VGTSRRSRRPRVAARYASSSTCRLRSDTGPTQEEEDAKARAALEASFRALAADAPVEEWLVFTRDGIEEPIRLAAAGAIAARPGVVTELSALIRGEDAHAADVAMRAVSLMKPPPAGLAPAVADVARELADDIRAVNATPAAADPSYEKAAELSVRFTGWSLAAWALHGREGVDFLPPCASSGARERAHGQPRDAAGRRPGLPLLRERVGRGERSGHARPLRAAAPHLRLDVPHLFP